MKLINLPGMQLTINPEHIVRIEVLEEDSSRSLIIMLKGELEIDLSYETLTAFLRSRGLFGHEEDSQENGEISDDAKFIAQTIAHNTGFAVP